MPVPLNPPYVRPVVAGKSFPLKFYRSVAFDIRSLSDADGFIEYVPMAEDGEQALEEKQSIRFDLWAVAAAVPAAAAAMEAVMKTLPEIEAWQAQQAQ